MKTYSTYQEAKIANPEEYVYKLETQGAFVTSEIGAESVRFCDFESNGYLCNPVDYCMTVEKFLSDDYKFVEGDVVLGFSGVEVVSEGFSVEAYNEEDDCDNKIYVLRAAALDKSETTEWKNGDECRYKHDVSHEYTYIGRHPNTDGHYIFSEEKGITFVRDGFLSKPESPEEKEKRERLEAIDEITQFLNNLSPECKNKMEYVARAIVDKTNYRKGG